MTTRPSGAARAFDPQRAEDLAELLDALPSLVAYVDADGVNRYVNAATARWLRRPPDEVRGAHLRELLGEEGYQVARERLRAASRGEKQEFDRVFLTADGQITHAVTEYLPRFRDGRPDGFFVLTADVTSRVRAESDHLEATVRSAELEQRTSDAVALTDDVLQQLYAIGLHLDRLQRHPELLQDEAGQVLGSLQATMTTLRSSITSMLLAGEAAPTEGVVRRLVERWSDRTGVTPAVEVDVGVDGLPPVAARHLLTALSQILGTAARHGAAPFRVRILTEDESVRIEADGEDWPPAARADFSRMAEAVREDGARLEVDVTHPVVTRVGWERRPGTRTRPGGRPGGARPDRPPSGA